LAASAAPLPDTEFADTATGLMTRHKPSAHAAGFIAFFFIVVSLCFIVVSL
jgi:hypothetical protein